MTFLNLLLLGGMLALAVPLVIHLLNRSKFQVVEWGAMQFLDSTVQQNSRRLRWQQLLLLILRCAIPVVLAICMARPLLTFWTTASSDGQAAVGLVIDDSYSMQASMPSRESAFVEASKQVDVILKGMARGTHWVAMTPGDVPQNRTEGSTVDSARIRSLLETIKPSAGPAQFLNTLRDGLEELNGITQARKHLVVISDFRRRDWQGIDDGAFSELLRSASGAVPIAVSFLPLQADSTDNLSIRFDSEFSEMVGEGESLEARILVKNHGASLRKGVSVVVRIDDVDLASKMVDVAPNEEVQIVVPAVFKKGGIHTIQAKLDDPSPIQGDNLATLSVQCIERLNVLIVDPVAVTDPMDAPSAFVEMAIEAQESPQSGNEADRWIQISRIHADGITEPSIKKADVLIFAGVAKLPDMAKDWIAARVREGAGMIWFPGDATDPNWFNQNWHSFPGGSLLPFRLGNRRNAVDFQGESFHLSHEKFQDPLLGFFSSGIHGKLDRIDLQTWYQLELPRDGPANATQSSNPPPKEGDSKELPSILAKLSNGDPWLVRSTLGKGRIYQFSSSCNDQWNNGPLRPIFVPLMQRLVLDARFPSTSDPGSQRIDESDLDSMTTEEIQSLAKKLNARVLASGADFLEADRLSSTGRELWCWMLLVLILFLFGELFLQKPLTRGTP